MCRRNRHIINGDMKHRSGVGIMRISVKYFATFYEVTGRRMEMVELSRCKTLRDLVDHMTKKYGGEFAELLIDPTSGIHSHIMINGQINRDAHTRLKDGDVVAFFPPIAGG